MAERSKDLGTVWRQKAADLVAQAERYRAAADVWDETQNGASAHHAGRGRTADNASEEVLRVLDGADLGRDFRFAELVTALGSDGRVAPSQAAVRMALSRLVGAGKVRRVGRGVYASSAVLDGAWMAYQGKVSPDVVH